MSSLTWLDYSDRQRREALDVIDLFREQDTVDELGLGTIRDAFADFLFPGTSTIQTRARYFLFLPWVFLDLERRGTPSAKISGAERGPQGVRELRGPLDQVPFGEDASGFSPVRAWEAVRVTGRSRSCMND